MSSGAGPGYRNAVEALVAATQREESLLAESRRDDIDGADRPLGRVRRALDPLGEAGQIQLPHATPESGSTQQLATQARQARQDLERAADAIEKAARVAAESRGDASRRKEILNDLQWRVTAPVLLGLVVILVVGRQRAIPLPVVAPIAGSLAGLAIIALGAYLYRLLLPTAGRKGLRQQDAGLLIVGTVVAVYAIIVAAAPPGIFGYRSDGQRAMSVVVAAAAGYMAYKRLTLWRSAR